MEDIFSKRHNFPDGFNWLSIPCLQLSLQGAEIACNTAFKQLSDDIQASLLKELRLLLNNSTVKESGHKTTQIVLPGIRYRADIFSAEQAKPVFFCFLHRIQGSADAGQNLYLSVFKQSGEAIMITDADDEIIDVNHAFELKTGYELAAIRYKKPTFLRLGLAEEETLKLAWQDVGEKGYWSGELKNRKANGEYYVCWLSLSAIKDETGQVSHYISIFSDITQHIQEHKKYKQLAYHDFLTGLPNRALLEDRFEQFILHNKRQGTADKCAVIFIDINKFKEINDTYGHQIGDQCLIAVAEILKASIRADDTASRFSGDEFVLLLTQLQETTDPERVIEEIKTQLADLHTKLGIASRITLSTGVCVYPDEGHDLETLIIGSDQKMYQQKKNGRSADESSVAQ